jgi:hypothetical protein
MRAVAGADPSRASKAQAAEMADGKATVNEYHAAFQRYRECMRAAGFELEDVRFKDDIYEFGVPAAAVEDSDADAECYDREYYFTDTLWQSSAGVVNASETTQQLRRCLDERGIAPEDTRADIERQLREHGIGPVECFR